jgi:hypothetical protein
LSIESGAFLFIGGPAHMETRVVTAFETIQIAATVEDQGWIPGSFEYVPSFKSHSYFRRKFKFGNATRSIYVHGDMSANESEEVFFSIVTHLFDLFVEA